MARRTKVVTIDNENGRDHGKTFLITEMSADAAEWWAIRALQGIVGANPDIDIDIFTAPLSRIAGFAFVGLAKIPADQLKPLMDEMKTCISVLLPDGRTNRALLSGDVEDIMTWVELRKEVFEVLTGFSVGGSE
jgi:hypothetical protein